MQLGALLTGAVSLSILFSTQASIYELIALFFSLGFFSSAETLSYPTVSESNAPATLTTALGFVSIIVMSLGDLAQSSLGYLLNSKWHPHFFTTELNASQLVFLTIPVAALLSFLVASFVKETFCENIGN
jgi:MFS family permease